MLICCLWGQKLKEENYNPALFIEVPHSCALQFVMAKGPDEGVNLVDLIYVLWSCVSCQSIMITPPFLLVFINYQGKVIYCRLPQRHKVCSTPWNKCSSCRLTSHRGKPLNEKLYVRWWFHSDDWFVSFHARIMIKKILKIYSVFHYEWCLRAALYWILGQIVK